MDNFIIETAFTCGGYSEFICEIKERLGAII